MNIFFNWDPDTGKIMLWICRFSYSL